jgi:hypothetical protein
MPCSHLHANTTLVPTPTIYFLGFYLFILILIFLRSLYISMEWCSNIIRHKQTLEEFDPHKGTRYHSLISSRTYSICLTEWWKWCYTNFTYLFPLNLGVNNQSAIRCIWSSSTNSWLHAPPGSSKLKVTVEFEPSPIVWQKCGNCSDWAIWRYPICSHPPPSIWVYPVGFYQKGCMAISQFTTTSSSSSSSSSSSHLTHPIGFHPRTSS